MSDELLKRAEQLSGDLSEFMPLAAEVVRDLAARVRELEAALEQERVRLAACGVIAESNTHASLARHLPPRDAYGYSASLDAVLKGVLREILERERADKAEADNERLRKIEDAARELVANVEEYDCDGLGLFAQHGWWEPLHEAMERADEADADDKKPA